MTIKTMREQAIMDDGVDWQKQEAAVKCPYM